MRVPIPHARCTLAFVDPGGAWTTPLARRCSNQINQKGGNPPGWAEPGRRNKSGMLLVSTALLATRAFQPLRMTGELANGLVTQEVTYDSLWTANDCNLWTCLSLKSRFSLRAIGPRSAHGSFIVSQAFTFCSVPFAPCTWPRQSDVSGSKTSCAGVILVLHHFASNNIALLETKHQQLCDD